MTCKTYLDEDYFTKWEQFTRYFSIINERDSITSENYLDVIRIHQEAGKDKIVVRHMFYKGRATIRNFCIEVDGTLERVEVWKEVGGFAAWDVRLIKLVDRPKKKREKKPKPKPKAPRAKKKIKSITECKTHLKYTATRSPRKDCPGCWEFYYFKHPDKKK